MNEDADLFTQQQRNRVRSRLLILAFIAFFAWLGFGGDWILWQFTLQAPPEAYRHTFPLVGTGLTLLAGVGALIAWH